MPFFCLMFKMIWSNPSHPKKSIFQSISYAPINTTDGKSSQNWSRKWYGLLYFDQNFSRYFKLKLLLFCWLSTFSAFFVTLILYISRSLHRNIANQTIFVISFFSSFHRFYLYVHLRYAEKYFFQDVRGLTIEF